MLDCVHTLEAPGVPVEFTYSTKAGVLTLSAQSYAFSASRGIVYLDHPRIRNPKGEVIAELSSVMASGLDLMRGSDQIVKVTGSDLKGRVIRQLDGRFDFQDYLPSTTASAQPTPFDVRIDRCQVQFVDRTANSEWTRTVTSPVVKVAGLGQDWIATAQAQVVGVGSADVKIDRTSRDGLQITASTDGLQLAQVLTHFQDTPDGRSAKDLAPLRVESLKVAGPVRFYLPNGARPNIEIQAKGSAAGIRYGKYHADRAAFTGLIAAEGFKGVANLADGKTAATFQGSAVWNKGLRISGSVIATSPGSASLPSWSTSFLPKDLSFTNGQFKGWVSVRPDAHYRLTGEADAATFTYAKEIVEAPRVNLDATDGRVLLDILRANYGGQAIAGAFALDLHARTIQGSASVAKLNLAAVARRFGYNQVDGEAFVSATLDGPVSKPNVSFITHGHGNITLPKEHPLSLGQFEGVGRFENGTLILDRAYFDTPEGLLTAHGVLGEQGNLGLIFAARGVRLSAYDPDLGGTANVEATILGSVKSPRASGRVEAYNLSYRKENVPAAAANFSIDPSLLSLEQIEAARGTASLAGSVRYRLHSGDLTGLLDVHDVQLADWLGDEYAGAVDMPSVELSGNVKSPIVDVTVKGTSLVARGVKLDSLSGSVRSVGDRITVNDLTLNAANGTVKASGSYDLQARDGTVSAFVNGLSLDQLTPELSDTVVLTGQVSGQATAAIKDTQIDHVSLEGTLASVFVNGLSVGNGLVQAESKGRSITGEAHIGDLNRYFSLEAFSYDLDTKQVTGSFDLYNLRAENLVSEGLHYLPDASPDLRDALQSVSGFLTATGKIGGPIDDLSLTVDNLTASDLAFRKDAFGTLTTSFNRTGHKWTIDSLKLSGGPALFALNGTIEENGQVHIDGKNENLFDLSKLGDFDPQLSGVTGTARLKFGVDGPTQDPHLSASLKLENLLSLPGAQATPAPTSPSTTTPPSDKNLTIDLKNIDVTASSGKQGGIKANGVFSYRGIEGTIDASAPFQYPFKVAADGPATATITVAPSSLKTYAAFAGGIDANRTSGAVSGEIKIQGDANNLSANGSLNLKAETLAFNSVEDTLKGVEANVALTPTQIEVRGSGSSSRSGSFTVLAAVPIDGLSHLIDEYRQQGTTALLDRPLKGSASVSKFLFRDSIMSDAISGSGSMSADLALSGTLRAPVVAGTAGLSNGDITMNGFQVGSSAAKEYPINPRFDLKLTLSDPARLRSSTADMHVLGEGTLQGTLQNPKVDGSLYLENGTVRLPAALVRLQQGGTVKIGYQASNIETTATAQVDLEGNTSLTASRYADTTDFQRYDITLDITGDLLQQQGLTVKAESDPPDLSQDRIMAILGQADILQSLSNGSRQSEAVSAALGFAVPSILDPLTSQIARGIGFDYLNLEYNSFDQASVAFGKALGAGFSVVGSHEISQPPPGFPYRYDLRIVYRPRRLPGAFNRLSFFFGADQDRPWKLGLDYGFRF